MERSEYDKLDRLEDRMWWFGARDRNLLGLLHGMPTGGGARPILDAGCGTGGFLARLTADRPDYALFGLDIEASACRRAAAKSGRPVCAGSIDALPFSDGVFAAVLSLDVLCHGGVDERHALRQFHRCLAEDGWLVVNLPAYRWLLSRHDAAVHNIRRYTAGGLTRLLERAGFRCVYTTYWNTLLFPLMVITRKLLPRRNGAASDVTPYPGPIDALCRAATRVETLLLRAGWRLPFGGSVLAVAAKEGAVNG